MKSYIIKVSYLVLSTTFLLTAILMMSCTTNDSVIEDNSDLIKKTENIVYYTENYPPFNYEENGGLYGVSIDILDELFIKMNANLSRQNVNLGEWSEVYQTTLETENTMLFSAVRNDERENLFKWIGPIAPQKEVIISLTSSNIVINSENDLFNYNIGVIRNYSNIQLLVNYGISTTDLTQVDNSEELYTILQNGTVDCIAFSEIGHNLLVSGWGLNAADFELPFIMKVNELYYVLNVNTGDDVINFFQNALDDLKDDKATDGSSIYDKIIAKYNIINHSDDGISNEQVINLVNQTSNDISADASGTLVKINNSENPYHDTDFPALYTFVYDTTLTVVAHATNSLLVGNNLKGKPDVSGKLFRDEILAGALANGTGWEDYIYTKPGEGGLYYKTTYYKLTTGSDGELYIVCAGKYK